MRTLFSFLRKQQAERQWEPLWESLRRLSRHFQPGGIIDVGANVGIWAVEAGRIFGCPLHMIEAQRELEPQLKQTGFPYTVALLGAENKSAVPFHLHGTGSSVLEELTTFERTTTALPMVRLDDLDLELADPLFIKLDVQGYELEVLSGAAETLKRTEVILAEVSLLPYNRGAPLMHETIAALAERGFLPFDVCDWWRRDSDEAMAQADILFVRADSQLRAHRSFSKYEP